MVGSDIHSIEAGPHNLSDTNEGIFRNYSWPLFTHSTKKWTTLLWTEEVEREAVVLKKSKTAENVLFFPS